MGLLAKLKKIVLGEQEQPDDWQIEGDEAKETEEMNQYYDDDNGPTLLYSGNPQIQDIRTQGGGYVHGDPAMINDINMRETARINNSVLIPGQVVSPRQRQARQGGAPRRLQGAPMAGQASPAFRQQQQLQRQQQWQRQQWEQAEQQRQWEAQQAEEQRMYAEQQNADNFYQQQAYYQQQQEAAGVKRKAGNASIHRELPLYGEPYYEMIVANGKYHFYVDMPGVKKEDIKVNYDHGFLILGGVRHLKSELMIPKVKGKGNKGKEPEFEAQVTIPDFVENFRYQFEFPKPVDMDSFKSNLADGILHVEMTIVDENVQTGVQISVG